MLVLVVLLCQSVFRMADACDVANDSPLAHDCVVEARSRQEYPWVEVAIPPEYSLHELWKAFVLIQKYSYKAMSLPLPAYPAVCWHLECSLAGGRI